MDAPLKTYTKQKLICPHCQFPMVNRTPMTEVHYDTPKRGTMIVCANCVNVSIIGDNGPRPMTKDEFEALPLGDKVKLASTAMGVKKMAGAWNPKFLESEHDKN